MKLMTITEYAKHKGVTRQAVQDRIRRGTLAVVVKNFKRNMIPVDDTNDESVK